MKPEELVVQIRKEVIEQSLNDYKDQFQNTKANDASDPYWKEALTFFSGLSVADKSTFFKIIRQLGVDTTSHLLGILDGTSWLEGLDEELELKREGSDELLNGDLQEIFLVLEEGE